MEMVSVFSKMPMVSKCFAEEETGRPMDSLADTRTTKETLSTSWLMDGLQEWVHMCSIQSRDRRSIIAARVRAETKSTKSSAMASRDS